MNNMINYLKEYADLSFDEYPFNSVDSLILSQLSYIQFEKSEIDIESNKHYLSDFYDELDTITSSTRVPEENKDLYLELIHSLRFENISISNFVYNFDMDNEKQFCAMTFHLPQHIDYIAFRGTDATIIGWKEDLNLSFSQDIPSQKSALNYVNMYNKKNTLLLGGHSKGANLATYAGLYTKKSIQAIYNHDGPAFLEPIQNINSVPIMKTIPQSSVIGLLMEQDTSYQVIQSSAHGILQHDPFTWNVDNGEFIYLDDIDNFAKTIQKLVQKILDGSSAQTRQILINSVFEVLLNTDASTFKEIEVLKLIKSVKNLDEQTKKELISLLKKEESN